jgi:hypothetical protein
VIHVFLKIYIIANRLKVKRKPLTTKNNVESDDDDDDDDDELIDDGGLEFAGYLFKRSNNMLKDWKRRYFEIKDGVVRFVFYMLIDRRGLLLIF